MTGTTATLPAVDEQEGALDVWGFLERRKEFILILSLVGVGLAYLWFEQEPPVYRTAAQIQVIYRGGNMGTYGMLLERNDLEDAPFIVKSPKILQVVNEREEIKNLQLLDGLGPDQRIARMSRMLRTEELTDNVLEIICDGPNPDEIETIANAVASEFVKYHEQNYEDSQKELERLLTQARDQLHEDLKRAEVEYQEFRETSSLMSDGSNPSRERQAQFENKVNQQAIRETELLAEIQSIEEALENDESREAILMMISQRADTRDARRDEKETTAVDSTARGLMQHLFPLLTEEAMLAAQVGEDHPRLVEIRKRIEFTRKHYQELAGLIPTDDPEAEAPDFVAVYLEALKQELAGVQRAKRQLETRAAQEEISARKIMKDEIANTNRQNEMARLSSLFESVATQIKQNEFNATIGGVKAGVLRPARHGDLVYPILAQFLGMGGVAGAFAGLLLGYLVELADRRFRKAEEIIREFGVPIVGHIPQLDESRLRNIPEGSPMDPSAVAFHLPRSRPAEAFRRVRTALCFGPLGSGHRVIQVTSPTAGDGKSTLALNLAISMATSGKKTILLESDFRRPRVHKLTGVPNAVGVVEVLRGEVELDDAIQSTPAADLFALPCGRLPKDPAELLTRPEYERLLQVLREKFDYVIIDTPPVLAVSDPSGVAPRADGVIVCFRLTKDTRDLGRRTLDQLRDVGARLAGLVVIGVVDGGSYGYGNYRNSDYANYYKHYNNRYSYEDYNTGEGHDDDGRADHRDDRVLVSFRDDEPGRG